MKNEESGASQINRRQGRSALKTALWSVENPHTTAQLSIGRDGNSTGEDGTYEAIPAMQRGVWIEREEESVNVYGIKRLCKAIKRRYG